jgi:hypothetical protein
VSSITRVINRMFMAKAPVRIFAIRGIRVASATLRDCPLSVNESHVSSTHSATGRSYPATNCGLYAFCHSLCACRVIFGATTEVLLPSGA